MKGNCVFSFSFLMTICVASVLFSCATKPPALSNNGKPFPITEYEKIAQREFDNKNYENAILAYNAIIENYPDNKKAVVWANYEIGFCHFLLKEYEEAERYFRIVINEYQEPAATKLAQDRIEEIGEKKKK